MKKVEKHTVSVYYSGYVKPIDAWAPIVYMLERIGFLALPRYESVEVDLVTRKHIIDVTAPIEAIRSVIIRITDWKIYAFPWIIEIQVDEES